MKTTEAELITHAVTELRKQKVAVTPGNVERAANAARPTVTVAEATAMVRAACEKLERLEHVAPAEPEREVVGMYLSPRTPDGARYARHDEYGGVEKVIRVGPKPPREYAPPVPHFAVQDAPTRAPDHAPGSIPPGPTMEDELASLKAEAKRLQKVLDDPATSVAARERADIRLTAVWLRIEQLEAALHPAPQAGKSPTAGA